MSEDPVVPQQFINSHIATLKANVADCFKEHGEQQKRIVTLEAQRKAMRVVLQSHINLLETIKNSRKDYVGDHTIYSVQLNESAIDSLYAQVKEVYEER
ncbi:hypothetical protein LCGC14_2656960 [marine sediment metagenome]|uniref:Uncharacterized protein n=1 Tax=marine sediment metagenome TaxID=412755 RepID=A0A0F9C3H0_9ZZZZ